MNRYLVSRVYATRHSWRVLAETESEALAMLNDGEKTPSDTGEEEWLGDASVLVVGELKDECELQGPAGHVVEPCTPGCLGWDLFNAHVERCDACNKYPDDEIAAEAARRWIAEKNR